MLQEDNRDYNWYHGYTSVTLPYPKMATSGFEESYDFSYNINTFALNGSISTKHFGEKFDAQKFPTDIQYSISINPPSKNAEDHDVTLHINIESVSESGIDRSFFQLIQLDAHEQNVTKVFSPPYYTKEFKLQRKVSQSDVSSMHMKLMPGFKIDWFYSGNVEPHSETHNYQTRLFKRCCFINLNY